MIELSMPWSIMMSLENAPATKVAVWAAECDEVCILREVINDHEDDRLAIDAREPLDEVHRNVDPHQHWGVERLQEPRWVQVFDLVLLARQVGPDIVIHRRSRTEDVEVDAEAV
jgi:hypothetical protein